MSATATHEFEVVDGIVMRSPSVPVSMADDWFALVSEQHPWFEWRFKVLERLMKRAGWRAGDEVGDCLEIGCGSAVSTRQFETLLDAPVTGCDLNVAAMKQAGDIRGELHCYDIHERHEDWRGKFGLVLLLDTLEHIDEPIAFLESVKHHMRPGGMLVINVPALPKLYSKYDEAAGHVQRYTQSSLMRELLGAQLEPLEMTYWGMTSMPLLWVRKMMLRNAPREKIIERGFDASSSYADLTLKALMHAETGPRLPCPVGSSLAAVARKPVKA